MRQEHRPGEALQVDYAGDTVVVMDGGQAREAQIFVACLPFSGLIHAEATWTQQVGDGSARMSRRSATWAACRERWCPTT